MTKEITKAIILQEIQNKLKLREFASSNFLFDETVVPIYDIGPHLLKWETKREIVSITSATNFLLFQVPQNEQWKVRRYNVIFHAVGAYTLTGIYIRRSATDFLYLDMEAGQSASYMHELTQDAFLLPGEYLRVLVDSYTSTANLEVAFDVQVEEIR